MAEQLSLPLEHPPRLKIKFKFLRDLEAELKGHHFYSLFPDGNCGFYLVFAKNPVSANADGFIFVSRENYERAEMEYDAKERINGNRPDITDKCALDNKKDIEDIRGNVKYALHR